MGVRCFIFGHEEVENFSLLGFGYVKSIISCSVCNKVIKKSEIYNLAKWKEVKAMENEPIKINEEIILEKFKKYTFKGFETDDTPPCQYQIILKHRDNNIKDKIMIEVITNELDHQKKHKFGTPMILDGKEIKSILCVAKAMTNNSTPGLFLDIVPFDKLLDKEL